MAIHTETADQHAEEITERLRTLTGYSPIRLITEVPGIHGAKYEKPWQRSDEGPTASFARLGGTALTIEADGDNIQVLAQTSKTASPTILRPSDIQSVDADHPYGNHMPLNGRRVPSAWPVYPHYPGTATFAWAPRFIEYDWMDYVVTGTHPEYPGISIVKAYNAQSRNWRDGTNPIRDIPTFDEAVHEQSGMPITHLISKVEPYSGWQDGVEQLDYVVTSACRLKGADGKGVIVRRPQHPDNDRPAALNIDMYDLPEGTTEDKLLETHIKRWGGMSIRGYNSKIRKRMTLFEADSVYMYMSAD